jgi:hypothetical protein
MEGKLVQMYNINTSSFPDSDAPFLSNITPTTTELHDLYTKQRVLTIQNGQRSQLCSRKLRIHKNVPTDKI